jgi:hypothetical protein
MPAAGKNALSETTTTTTSGPPAYCDFIPAPTLGPCIEAKMQCGDWGAGSVPELLVNASEGNVAWSQSSSGELDSGQFSVNFVVSAGRGASLGVSQSAVSGSVFDGSVSYGAIQHVEVGASVAGTYRRFTWSSIVVRFYRAGVLTQTMYRGVECWPKADTYGVPSIGSQTVRYRPTSADNDAVTVTAQVRLQLRAPLVLPYESQGKILVFAANCVPG